MRQNLSNHVEVKAADAANVLAGIDKTHSHIYTQFFQVLGKRQYYTLKALLRQQDFERQRLAGFFVNHFSALNTVAGFGQ